MASMNISLPDQMKSWVDSRTDNGQYSNTSDYVRDLIRHDQQRIEKLEALRGHLALGEKQLDNGERINGEEFFDSLLSEMKDK